MTFNSLTFAVFLAVVFAAHRLPIPWRWKKGNLLVASYLFYAAWNPPFVLLIWLSTVVDWKVAAWMHRAERAGTRRALLVVSVLVNLGVLGFFKYADLALETFVGLTQWAGFSFAPVSLGLVLPVGISFYTFQSLSYTIDVYRRDMDPWDSFADFALFVTFFPQLVAGPIVRAASFLPQLARKHRATNDQVGWGLALLTLGLFQKVVLADALTAPVADLVFAAPARAGWLDAWVGTLAFANQIFFDFAGYSTCAIGVALMFGFVLPDNFRFPYAAVGFSDFWRRWHISLSTWLRDYLYIPLGGNRGGTAFVVRNLMLTMLLGGLWHGANWRFVAWGGLHGAYLVVERGLRARRPAVHIVNRPAAQFLLSLMTFYWICIAWVFFRAETFADARILLGAMLWGAQDTLSVGASASLTVVGLTGVVLIGHWIMRDSSVEQLWARCPWWLRAAGLTAMLYAITISGGEDRAFVYFQF